MSAVDYVERAEAYVAGVLDGSIPANRLARLACERHVRDKEHAAGLAPTFYLDADSANHACAFIERCPHVKGEWARRGELLTLSGWQAFIIVSLFGWRWTATNARRFNTALVEVPRKNGKSALCSPILLYMFALDGEAGPEVYSAATKAAQARIVFDSAKAMARKMPDFVRRAALKIEEHAIKVKNDDVSVIKPLEAKKLDGLNPHCSVIDELHEHPTAAVYDALDQARGARDQSLLLAITTAGDDLGGVCYAQHDYVERILNRVIEDDAYFGIIYCADEGDDPFAPETWAKANPNLGVSKSRQYLETQATKAQASPQARGAFLRKHLDVWTSAGVAAFDLDGWRAGERPATHETPLVRADYAAMGGKTGVDLALKGDLCAVVSTNWNDAGELVVFGDYFVTEAVAKLEGNEHLFGWVLEDRVRMCPGHLMDLEEVEECVRAHVDHFGTEEIVYDPQFAAMMANRLAADGYLPVEFRGSPMNMDGPFQLSQGLVSEGRLITDGDPVLRWMAANTIVEKRGEFERPAKKRDQQKIDGIAALVTALGRMQQPEEESHESVYETRGLRVL